MESAAILRTAAQPAGCRVIGAGCGTGRFSAVLADQHHSVTGIDPDRGMLRLALARTSAGCARAAVESLPFPDGSFDLTLAVTVLEFVAEPAAAVAERVTRDGGRLVIGALNPHSPWGLANRRRFRSDAWYHARFLTRRELRQLAAPHGTATLRGALYAPGLLPGLPVIGSLLETLGRLAPTFGAFPVLAVDEASQ